MALQTRPFDSAAVLDTREAIIEYVNDAFESEDPAVIAHALGVVARAQGVSKISEQTGLSRQALYKALSPEGNPELATVLKVARALGLQLTATPLPEPEPNRGFA